LGPEHEGRGPGPAVGFAHADALSPAVDRQPEPDAGGVEEALRQRLVRARQVLDLAEAEVPPLVELGPLGETPDLVQRAVHEDLDIDAPGATTLRAPALRFLHSQRHSTGGR